MSRCENCGHALPPADHTAPEAADHFVELAKFLGAPKEAETDVVLLRQWWEAADSDTQAWCHKELIPAGW